MAARLQRADLPPARGDGRAGRAVARRDDDPPGRHPPARQVGELAHPWSAQFADLPRDVPRVPLHRPRGDRRHARLGPVREDLDARRATTRRCRTRTRFAAWDEPGTVRVAFAHWARELDDGRAELCSEARVHPVDTTARLRLKAIWALLGPFERLVGAEPLELAVRRAQDGT